MSVRKVKRRSKPRWAWEVRWREGGRNRAKTFLVKSDAENFDWNVKRARSLGIGLDELDAGKETLGEFVSGTWAPARAITLAPKTREHYTRLYDQHLRPEFGAVPLRELTPGLIQDWQGRTLGRGAGPVAVRHALDLLGVILQHAVMRGRIPKNPVRRVERKPLPLREEVRPLAPATIEKMRAAVGQRDATLISVLAYGGLRPGEALGLRWGDVRDRTMLIERAVSLGEIADTKTRAHRTVRLLAPLANDLREWRLASGRPGDREHVFPGRDGRPWTLAAYQSWRRRAFKRALTAAKVEHARPYDLRHSFASLLLHEGRREHYVARQLGHDPRLTISTYGHVIDEFEDAPTLGAEEAIRAARESAGTRFVRAERSEGGK